MCFFFFSHSGDFQNSNDRHYERKKQKKNKKKTLMKKHINLAKIRNGRMHAKKRSLGKIFGWMLEKRSSAWWNIQNQVLKRQKYSMRRINIPKIKFFVLNDQLLWTHIQPFSQNQSQSHIHTSVQSHWIDVNRNYKRIGIFTG